MALKANIIPYIALLSLLVSLVPGFFWLYRRIIQPRKNHENDRLELRRSIPPSCQTERQLPPAYLYLEESRSRKAWIVQQDAPAHTSSHVLPASRRVPRCPIAALGSGSQIVCLGPIFPTYTHQVADRLPCRDMSMRGLSVMLHRVPCPYSFDCLWEPGGFG